MMDFNNISNKVAGEFIFACRRDMIARKIYKCRFLHAYEFSSKKTLDEYLKQHPKADPKNHWVKPIQKEVTKKQQAPAEFKPVEPKKPGRLYIPPITAQHNLTGDLSNVSNWKVPIILGNSIGNGQKKGDLDSVGYVAIGIDTDEMIPIARADEHQAGYELLHHLRSKGKIKGKKYVTLFPHSNYLDYMGASPEELTTVCKKWRDNGGVNAPISNGEYLTDFDGVIESKGIVPKKYEKGEISKPLKRQLDLMQKIKDGDADSVKNLAGEMATTSSYLGFDYEKEQGYLRRLNSGDIDDARDVIFGKKGIIKDLQDQQNREYPFHGKFYGDKDAVKGALNKLSSDETSKKQESKPAEDSKIKPKAQETIKLLEDMANTIAKKNPGFISKAKNLSEHLWYNADYMGIDKDVLTELDSAIEDSDNERVAQILYSFDGIKNKLHNRLRQNVKDKKEDEWFGDSQQALDEFNRLSQI